MSKAVRQAVRLAPAAFFVAAVLLLHREFSSISKDHLWSSFASISDDRWVLAGLATAAGYLVLTFYDWLALRFLGAPVPWRKAAEGAFLSFAVSHNVGLGWLSGGAMRQRVYAPLGVSLATVARVTVLNSVTFFAGAFGLLGLTLVAEPLLLRPLLPMSTFAAQAIGCASIFCVLLYLLVCATRRRPIGWNRVNLPVPPLRLAAVQLLLSSADILLAAAALYLLLPPQPSELGFVTVVGVYLVAVGVSLATHVPGGLGIFETMILWSMPDVPTAPLLASLVAYRLVYYLLPLFIALLLAMGGSIATVRRRMAGVSRTGAQGVPLLAAAVSFGCGAYLLFAGATGSGSLSSLRLLVPLPLLELSHLAGSVAGLGLVMLAGALYRRFDSARDFAISLLIAGAISTSLGGHGGGRSLALALGALIIFASRRAFYRHGSLLRNAVSSGWILLGMLALGASVALGFHTYAQVSYSNDLWWQFAYEADAPRFLRASSAAAAVALVLLIRHLLGPAPPQACCDISLDQATKVVRQSPDANANLALLGDKRFLWSESHQSFIMYQVQGRRWIAMGDPVGPPDEWSDLIWSFLDGADRAGNRPFFYETSGQHLELYAQAGLVAHKLGEEARVPLRSFDLNLPQAKALRAALRRGEREGLRFEIVSAHDVPVLLDELQLISKEWLAAKHAREKGFSLGSADPVYLSRCDCAVVRWQGEIVAFANLWRSGSREEFSLDLMRHRRRAPRVTMTFLMTQLMLRARVEGYRWFNLGMAPLAGMSTHRLAPLPQLVARIIFEHGERLYGFAGLRTFKNQFRPVWRSRYAVCEPGVIALAGGLLDCSRLIGRASRPFVKMPRSRLGPGRAQKVPLQFRSNPGQLLPVS